MSIRKYTIPAVLSLALIGIATVQAQWVPPTGNAPSNNVPPPINTSSTFQRKDGLVSFDKLFVGSSTSSAAPTFLRSSDKIQFNGGATMRNNLNIQLPTCGPQSPNGPVQVGCTGYSGSWNPSLNYGISSNAPITGYGLYSNRNLHVGGGTPVSTATGVVTAENNIYTKKSVYSDDLKYTSGGAGSRSLCSNNADGKIIPCASGSGGGTNTAAVTNAANVGSGIGLFKDKAGTVLNFKSLVAGNGITFDSTTNQNQITISNGNPNNYGPASVHLSSTQPEWNDHFNGPIPVERVINLNGAETYCSYKITGSKGTATGANIKNDNSWSGVPENQWSSWKNYGATGNYGGTPVYLSYSCSQLFSSGCNSGSGDVVAQLHVKCYNGYYGQTEHSPVYAWLSIAWRD